MTGREATVAGMSNDRWVRRWLLAAAAAVVVTVAVGGLTRLTQSGLSITEWKPVAGVLPPLSHSAWEDVYQRYQQIPEAQTVHKGITLERFQVLYWWEWSHRMVARLVGLILALPYLYFLARGMIRKGLRWRLLALPLLVAAQGALGWYMVSSGLAVRTDVSAYRLTAHLSLALAIYIVAVWTVLDLGTTADPPAPKRWRLSSIGLLILTLVTIVSGGFVAGLDAGKIYNTFPLMAGRVVPAGYHIAAFGWRNPFENPIAAQFDHRLLALMTATLIVLMAAAARRAAVSERVRRATAVAGLAVLLQVALGITVLLLAVPVVLGVLHQLNALFVLTAMLVVVHRANRPGLNPA